MKTTTTKLVTWFCLINGVLWVWCSYLLAYIERTEIVEHLSSLAITEIMAVILLYCLKSLFEKRESFGGVGSKQHQKEEEPNQDINKDL